MTEFRQRLQQGPWILGDAAMGTALTAAGVAPDRLADAVATHPDAVTSIHLAHLAAGARLLETYTFLANRQRLRRVGLEADTRELNRRGAQIARHARDTFGEPALIVGSLGPLGRPVGPGRDALAPAEAVDAYRPAVAGLLAGGVDGFMVETLSDVGTLEAAVAAIREESDLPIVAAFAFSPEGVTLYGVTPEEAARGVLALPGGPPDAAGTNCGSGPGPMLDAIWRMAPILRPRGVPLCAFPNAGQPQRIGGQVHYPADAPYLAATLSAFLSAGVTLLGGCCGTTATHVAAMADAALRATSDPVLPPPPVPLLARAPEGVSEGRGPVAQGEPNTWDLSGARGLAVSVELDPPRGVNANRLLGAAHRVQEAGAHSINIGDSPMARVRMSALATARLVREATRLSPIIHCTTRDRNRMGLASDLLGAHALGIRNVLCLTGDPPGVGDYAHATAVYDLDAVGLVELLQGFNQGRDGLGHDIGPATQFQIGVAANPNAEDIDTEVRRLGAKIEAGAHFVMTQPLYEADQLWRFLDRTGPIPIPLVVGVMPLVSHRQAEYLHHEVPGIAIPERQRQAMADAALDGEAVGLALSDKLVDDIRTAVAGLYLIPSYNRVEPLLPLIRRLTGNAQA